MNTARRWLAEKKGVAEKDISPILAGVLIPQPVFFCSIETSSLVSFEQLQFYLFQLPIQLFINAILTYCIF